MAFLISLEVLPAARAVGLMPVLAGFPMDLLDALTDALPLATTPPPILSSFSKASCLFLGLPIAPFGTARFLLAGPDAGSLFTLDRAMITSLELHEHPLDTP